MKKKNMNLLLALGGLAAVGGIAYYFYKKNQAPAAASTAGYFGATMLPGRQFPTSGQIDQRAYAAAGMTGY